MRRVLMGVTVVIGLAAGWLLLRQDEPPPNPAPEPLAVAQPFEPEVAAVPQPDSVVADAPPTDAGVRVQPIDVPFTLVRDGGVLVGARVTLRRNRETVSGTINVMGVVTLPLTPGEWTVSSRDAVSLSEVVLPDTVQVTPDAGLITLTAVPRGNLSVCVFDRAKRPALTNVYVRTGLTTRRFSTWVDGCLSEKIGGSDAEVWAEDYGARSVTKHVELPAVVKLQFEPLYSMSIDLLPEAVHSPRVSVTHRLGVSTGRCDTGCIVKVPSGEYELLAAGVLGDRPQFARRSGTAASADSDLKVNLSAAPPISGVVRSAAGVPLPNVPLRFLVPDESGVEMARVLTGNDGTFSVEPKLPNGAFFTWRIIAEPPWELASPAMVTLGDAPLELTAALHTQ